MRAYEVTLCVRCGLKPCALVGDDLPEDHLCPWCRSVAAPAVYLLFLRDSNAGAAGTTQPAAHWPEEKETR